MNKNARADAIDYIRGFDLQIQEYNTAAATYIAELEVCRRKTRSTHEHRKQAMLLYGLKEADINAT